jgi:hypothetical protein
MSGLERAQTYAAIFIGAGDGWRRYAPVDAAVEHYADVMYLQGIRMERVDAGWRLETNGQAWLVRPKAGVSA